MILTETFWVAGGIHWKLLGRKIHSKEEKCAKSSRKSVQNYLLLEGLLRSPPSPVSVNLFLAHLHQAGKEIQFSAAKEGFGNFSNCSTFGALPHYPLMQHLVNFFF